MKKYVSSMLLPLIMIGCGGDSNTVGSFGTGYYVDSPVEGVDYRCGSQSGTTDVAGMFRFESGQACTFSVNDLVFKSVESSALSDGVTIQESTLNIARFLQTLDNDGNPDNGIKISQDVVDALKELTKTPSTDGEFGTLNAVLANVSSYQGGPVSNEQAQEHLEERAGILSANATVSSQTIREGEALTISASNSTFSKGDITAYEWLENGQRVSTAETFSKSDFSLGEHTLTLVVKAGDNLQSSDTVTFNVIPATEPTKWDDVEAVDTNGANSLFVTSDENNLYIKLESPNDMSSVQFWINSDDSAISGLRTSAWAEDRFDYFVKNDGVYEVQHEEDYLGEEVQSIQYVIEDGVLEVAIDKDSFNYLAEDIGVAVVFGGGDSNNIPTTGAVKRFTDAHFDSAQADTKPPIITITGANPLVLNVGDAYNELGAVAQDVIAGNLSVSTDSAEVDTSKAGFYTVLYSATDGINQATNGRIVEVRGSGQSTLEVKNLGALQESVVINHQMGLVWANDNTKAVEGQTSTRGCIIIGSSANPADLPGMLTGYCDRSTYAGFTDWRVPTSFELSQFTNRMEQEGKVPGMARSGCTRTLSMDENNTVKAVWTHLMAEPGHIETDTLAPAGGRCVRGDTGTFSLPVADAGDDFAVDFNASFSFDASRSSDSDGQIVKYEWIFGGEVLNEGNTSSPIYTRLATQPEGNYTVLLRVTDDDGLTDEDTVDVEVR